MVDLNKLKPGHIVLLTDEQGNVLKHSKYFVCAGNELLFEVEGDRTRLVRLSELAAIKSFNVMLAADREDDGEWENKISDFFIWHYFDFRLPRLYLNAIREIVNINILEECLIPHLEPQISRGEYEARWDRLITLMQPGDAFFTCSPGNFISKTITKFTSGPWSHTGMVYKGDVIQEMLTSGVARRSITAYKDEKTRIGLYRPRVPFTDEQIEGLQTYLDEQMVNKKKIKYSYLTAILVGLSNKTGRTEPGVPSPMDLIYGGQLRMIHYV
jgi:hypothetical protein